MDTAFAEQTKHISRPTGGFIPIYKKSNVEKHVPTSGNRPNMLSISDIMNKKIKTDATKKN